MDVQWEGCFDVAVDLREIARERGGQRQGCGYAAIHSLERRSLERLGETSLDASVYGLGLDLARSRRVDVDPAVHCHSLHLAIDAVGVDTTVDGAQIERERSGYAKVVVDARFVAEPEEDEMMLIATPDDERIAGYLGAEIALVLLSVPRLHTASYGRIHRDFVIRAGLDVDLAIDLPHFDVADRAGGPLVLE